MKTIIVVLIITAFLQTTILPIDLVLIILICRSFIKSDRANIYLAFAFGLLVSYFEVTPLGITSLMYAIFIELIQILKKGRLAGNPFLVVPVCLVFLFLNKLINSSFNPGIINFQILILEAFLSLPILYLVRLWEERFIVRREIKLKI